MHEPSLFDAYPSASDAEHRNNPTNSDDHEETGPASPVSRVRLTIAYDGTDFRGLAPNPGVRTVVGELQRIFGAAFGTPPDIVMSGRTDAGVHAAEQVLSFDLSLRDLVDPDPKRVQAALGRIGRMVSSRLGPEIVTVGIELAEPDFSARFNATGRIYSYRILNRPVADPTLARYIWHIEEPLNLAVMRLACDPLIGEHDFSSFCRRPKVAPGDAPLSLIRRMMSASWTDHGDGHLEFRIHGSAFCHQMVRSIVGFHVSVGRGKRTAGELRSVLMAKDRQLAEPPAPPQGLHLVGVRYT